MTEISMVMMPEYGDLPVPEPATEFSSGVDLRAAVKSPETIMPGESLLVSTGIRVAIPPGWEWQIRPRSGLALKHGITVLNSPGTIDSDYRGTVGVILINHGREPFTVNRGERIAQAVLARVEHPSIRLMDHLPDSGRGEGGFGHTGR